MRPYILRFAGAESKYPLLIQFVWIYQRSIEGTEVVIFCDVSYRIGYKAIFLHFEIGYIAVLWNLKFVEL